MGDVNRSGDASVRREQCGATAVSWPVKGMETVPNANNRPLIARETSPVAGNAILSTSYV